MESRQTPAKAGTRNSKYGRGKIPASVLSIYRQFCRCRVRPATHKSGPGPAGGHKTLSAKRISRGGSNPPRSRMSMLMDRTRTRGRPTFARWKTAGTSVWASGFRLHGKASGIRPAGGPRRAARCGLKYFAQRRFFLKAGYDIPIIRVSQDWRSAAKKAGREKRCFTLN